MKNFISVLLCSLLFFISAAQSKRPLNPGDLARLQDVENPQVSPDGNWVAYELISTDTTRDETNADIWMVSWDGKQSVQLTNSDEDETSPKWSPDGKYLSFISSRDCDDDVAQVWLQNRLGGDAKKISDVKGEIEEYAWRPDGKKILLVMKDEDFSDTSSTQIRKPFVMDRYHFKEDVEGYLDDRKTHLYLLDIETEDVDTLTSGNYNEYSAAWSPDGLQIAFVSNRTTEPDRNENADIFVMDATKYAVAKQLTSWQGVDDDPVWSPDGKSIAYIQSSSKENYTMYGHGILAVITKDGGAPKLVSAGTDRPVTNPQWSKDGKSITALMEDDRAQIVAQFDIVNATMKRVVDGMKAFYNVQLNKANGNWLVQMSDPYTPFELYALENGNLRKLTNATEDFLEPLELPTVEGFKSTSRDGTIVSGILYKPKNTDGKKLPLILYIHGGPVAQDDYEFDLYRDILAAGGYAVAAINYRGSSGRGIDYIRAIYSDWGNKEVIDIKGAIDYLIAKGNIDSSKIGVAGWSYGGILTDYMIASDTRIKAAASGAGSALQLSMYGVDEYVTQYEMELGLPWKNLDKWLKVSYPFFQADKIKTPTLFMASQKDFNVPSSGAEQMYQALRTQGIPTQLVIYPNQYHEITVPSYLKDRFTRYLQWFGKYLKN